MCLGSLSGFCIHHPICLYMSFFSFLSICRPFYLIGCSYSYLSIYLFSCLFTFPPVYLFIYLLLFPPVSLYICPLISQLIYLLAYLFTCLYLLTLMSISRAYLPFESDFQPYTTITLPRDILTHLCSYHDLSLLCLPFLPASPSPQHLSSPGQQTLKVSSAK